MAGKLIRLYLTDGQPNGLRTVEISKGLGDRCTVPEASGITSHDNDNWPCQIFWDK
ncbi:hypothetical protein SPSIL_024430 [Sporomusa silvacetica DSM 10669]|uniref:Uncharacterized protein n=1 Tax=Sporomusa silvacetica DSM 10669 TaxID=1123289 RepID=A0ABZ3ILK5_9FIRM|nr:hypothetical protein SPSIL_53240 [Sporomusa silvacetica DSM 10669]